MKNAELSGTEYDDEDEDADDEEEEHSEEKVYPLRDIHGGPIWVRTFHCIIYVFFFSFSPGFLNNTENFFVTIASLKTLSFSYDKNEPKSHHSSHIISISLDLLCLQS